MLSFQELVAFGLSTMISAFFSSAAPSASLSRSLVQERVGGKTQVQVSEFTHVYFSFIFCKFMLVVIYHMLEYSYVHITF